MKKTKSIGEVILLLKGKDKSREAIELSEKHQRESGTLSDEDLRRMYYAYDAIDNNPNMKKLADESHRKLSRISPEELLREFTI